MADFPAAANGTVLEEGGPYYPVKFNWVPRVGELIDLIAFVEIRQKHPEESRRYYEVVAVVHNMHDVDEGSQQARHGHHNLTVVVKKSQSKYFGP